MSSLQSKPAHVVRNILALRNRAYLTGDNLLLGTSATSRERIQLSQEAQMRTNTPSGKRDPASMTGMGLSTEKCGNGPIAPRVRCIIRRCGATPTDGAAQPSSTAVCWLRCNGSDGMPANGQPCVMALAVASSFMRTFWPDVRQGPTESKGLHCAAAVVTRSERATTSIASPGSKSASSDAERRSQPFPFLRTIVVVGRTPLLAASTDAIRP